MAIRLDTAVVRGELSNETRGLVTGKIWLLGRPEPLELHLRGNCLRDIAGCSLKFTNPQPERDVLCDLVFAEQNGAVGDLTASRKTRIPTVSDEQLVRLMETKQPIPTRLANCLYLEWFSEANGRVVIEATDFNLEISAPEWIMTAEEESRQSVESQQTFHRYLDAITGMDLDDDDEDAFDDDDEENDDDFSNLTPVLFQAEELEPLNEFEWEQELRDGDRRAEAYQEAFDRYHDHPERERLIAEAMGWNPEEMDEELEELQEHMEEDPQVLIENASHLAADDVEQHHPLSHRAMTFALNLQTEAEQRGLLDQRAVRESPVLMVIVSIIAMGGKLVAALDPLMQGAEPERGFIIAMLKRAQVPLNEALHALGAIHLKGVSKDTRSWLMGVRNELFSLRNDILDLMKELRTQP
jgi:hypothetical protein